VDAIFKNREREELRGLLNAGYRRGAFVYRMGGKQYTDLEQFPVFCAKAFAGIGNCLPDTITDRSIPIELQRRAPEEHVERLLQREVRPEAEELRDRLGDWLEPQVDELRAARPALPEQLDDRAQDIWEPLLAIADLAGGRWPQAARLAALQLSADDKHQEDASVGIKLLAGIREVFDEGAVIRDEKVSCKALAVALNELEDDAPWAAWNKGTGITTRELGQKLKPYRIKAKTIRYEGDTPKGYERAQFEDAFRRYLPDPGFKPPQAPQRPTQAKKRLK
jgi:hypothetical protein